MDLSLSADERAFRDNLRAWLSDHHPGDGPEQDDAGFDFRREWQRAVYEGGWVGVTWPEQYGGRGATLVEQAIFVEESARARAPRMANTIALAMIGPTIIEHGTEDQQRRHLIPILSAEEIWCQGFSEPDAGSDLAAVHTRAVRDGDEWLLTGQKVWTSVAHRARRCMLLARTGPPEPTPTRGLTMFIVDMDQPGVVVRPLRQITGDAEFSELFLEQARVPDADVLGEVDGGWRVAITTLMHERATLSLELQADLHVALEELLELARHTRHNGHAASDDPILRQRLAALRIELEVMRLTTYRGMARTIETGVPGPEGALGKWQWADINQALARCALDLLGPRAALDDGPWTYRYLRSRANSIEGGTTEVLKNVLAERVLGLPRMQKVT